MPIKNKFISLESLLFLLLFILMIGIWFSDTNKSIFLLLNKVSYYTAKPLWVYLTYLGDAAIVISLSTWLLINNARIAGSLLIGGILVSLVVQGLKFGLDLSRPPGFFTLDQFYLLIENIKHFSFPSGHTATVFLIATFFLYGQVFQKWLNWSFMVLAFIAGFSRIAVGVHWPLDVLSGALIGWAIGLFSLWLNTKLEFGEKPWHKWSMLAIFLEAFILLILHPEMYVAVKPLYYSTLFISVIMFFTFIKKALVNQINA